MAVDAPSPHLAELALYVSDHATWRKGAAPRIAAVLVAIEDDDRLLDSWSMLRSSTKEDVWELLDTSLRDRIRALRKTRQQPVDGRAPGKA